jgi:type I restriction-modification system DNA methylase subunit
VATSAPDRPHRLIALCEALGYRDELRSERYAVLTPTGVTEVDLACFGKPEPKDMSTATIVGGHAGDSGSRTVLRESARALAAPIALLEAGTQIALWRIAPSPDHDRLLEPDFSEERLAEKGRLIDALAPESLVAHKRGFGGQLTLFEQDVALLSRARANAEQAISARIEAAMAALWPDEAAMPSNEQAEEIARTVVQALAVLVARDKMTADRSFDTALAVLQERYADVVAGLTKKGRQQRVRQVAALIGEGVDFTSLDSTILGDVYEGTFLKDTTRRHLGAYYTPPAVARKMLESVPVEEIEPSARTALDLTCGSGTLLLSAWERLSAAAPPDTDAGPGRLTGFDQDAFAVELARLALVIHDAPGSPTWTVSRRDALQPRPGTEPQHGIVVGNPPWGYERPNGVPAERATQFLEAMIRWCRSDGFIACLLPASWLSANVARESRRTLREAADVIEVWRLPETTFELSGVASCVVFAHKRQTSSRRWLYRRVHRNTLEHFLEDVRAAPGELVDETGVDDDAPFRSLAIEAQLSSCRRLIDVSEVRRGVPMPKGKAAGSKTGNVDLLPGYRQLRPFDRVRKELLVPARYPDDFSKRGESPEFWLRPKVLMATTTNVDGARRVRAFLDEVRVVPRNSMTAVVPRTNTPERRLALLSILNSRLIAEWLEGASMRWIGSELLEKIPVPDDDAWPTLAEKAAQILDAATEGARDDYVGELEVAVRAAYGLPRPEEVAESASSQPVDTLVTDDHVVQAEPILAIGTVLDARDRQLLLHVAGVTPPYGEWTTPPAGFPGWACRPGAGFQVLGADGDLHAAAYFPQELAWTRHYERPAVEAPA